MNAFVFQPMKFKNTNNRGLLLANEKIQSSEILDLTPWSANCINLTFVEGWWLGRMEGERSKFKTILLSFKKRLAAFE